MRNADARHLMALTLLSSNAAACRCAWTADVLRKGMAVRMWRFLMSNAVWGEDMMSPDLRYACHAQAVALTYMEVFDLSRQRLQDAGERNPAPYRKVQQAMRKIHIGRAILCYLQEANGTGTARSYVSRERASGFTFAAVEHGALEKKFAKLLDELAHGGKHEASAGTRSSAAVARGGPSHLPPERHSETNHARGSSKGNLASGEAGAGFERGTSDARLLQQLMRGQDELRRGQEALQAQLAALNNAIAKSKKLDAGKSTSKESPQPSHASQRSWNPTNLFA